MDTLYSSSAEFQESTRAESSQISSFVNGTSFAGAMRDLEDQHQVVLTGRLG